MFDVDTVSRYHDFAELATAIENIRGDPLEADGGNIVHYRGNPSAKLMVRHPLSWGVLLDEGGGLYEV